MTNSTTDSPLRIAEIVTGPADGRIGISGTAKELIADPRIREAYLGI